MRRRDGGWSVARGGAKNRASTIVVAVARPSQEVSIAINDLAASLCLALNQRRGPTAIIIDWGKKQIIPNHDLSNK